MRIWWKIWTRLFEKWMIFDARGFIGTRAAGDPKMLPTTDEDFSKIFKLWKKVTVFLVPFKATTKGYRIGFIPEKGPAKIMKKKVFHPSFRIRNGREDCTFFAVDTEGKEVPLQIVAQTTIDDEQYRLVPLY